MPVEYLGGLTPPVMFVLAAMRTSVPMQSGTPKPIWQIQIDAG